MIINYTNLRCEISHEILAIFLYVQQNKSIAVDNPSKHVCMIEITCRKSQFILRIILQTAICFRRSFLHDASHSDVKLNKLTQIPENDKYFVPAHNSMESTQYPRFLHVAPVQYLSTSDHREWLCLDLPNGIEEDFQYLYRGNISL